MLADWSLKLLLKVEGVKDPFSTFRLYRISILRELIKAFGEKPLVTADGWASNAELLMNTAPLARRIEKVSLAPRYDIRARETRIRPFKNAMDIYRFGWSIRGRRIVATNGGQSTLGASSAKTSAEAGAARKAGS